MLEQAPGKDCVDAHAHLGNLAFDLLPGHALRHHEMGLSIGAFSLGKSFDGVFPWGLLATPPCLRCLHGAALCWCRLRGTREAAAAFRKMLWLNPSDNQGACFELPAVEAGQTWEQMESVAR
ncbi:MAG: hypothetical protein ABIY55_20460 [Kofleriaceae bacterium]